MVIKVPRKLMDHAATAMMLYCSELHFYFMLMCVGKFIPYARFNKGCDVSSGARRINVDDCNQLSNGSSPEPPQYKDNRMGH